MPRMSDKSTEELLEMILYYLQRMEKRDKWRTVGGTIRSIINLIPIVILIVSTWYLYAHGEEMIRLITKTMTQQMTSLVPTPEQIQQMMSGGLQR